MVSAQSVTYGRRYYLNFTNGEIGVWREKLSQRESGTVAVRWIKYDFKSRFSERHSKHG